MDAQFQPLDRGFQTRSSPPRGDTRATVALRSLETLWFNTTLCNLTCRNCYLDRRRATTAWPIDGEDVPYLTEIARDRLPRG